MSVQPPVAGSGSGSPHPSQLPGPSPCSSVGTLILPSPPFISAPGVANLRDVGGYEIPSTSGNTKKMVRKGVVFRSADPTKLTDEGVVVMQTLGIAHVYDFRSKLEFGKTPETEPKEWEGAQRHWVPVFAEVDLSPEAQAVKMRRFKDYTNGPEGFVRAYSTILAGAADPKNEYAPYRTIFQQIASSPSPLLVHCSAGKDRTGLFIAILLSLLRLPHTVIAHEYSLTDLGLAHRKSAIVDHVMLDPAFDGDRAAAERMVSSRKEVMLATLQYIDAEYGGAEKYVIEKLGVTKEEVERIREVMVVDVEEGEQTVDWEGNAEVIEGVYRQ
ncbi:protein-tyrosine phosphatase-like protein [Pseudoneurospora amorphoporcata]|uniref:Protein-tyrosine phosphatase-like protein n=1 Tax=Pseudoneurospora amorphoporcata TaxID=241081 RepID=A0AAN6NVX7_9PEZI|nr:protein-tyrosine phosphatase-like protein [Pseudoneurospora amorphoporcata]